MVKRLKIRNFTAFSNADLTFGPQLNIIVGENATGKTHILKLIYSALEVLARKTRKGDGELTKADLQRDLADKLVGVFKPEYLGRLTRRKQGRGKSEVEILFSKNRRLGFSFATNSKKEVTVEKLTPFKRLETPAFIPTRELLTLYPDFVPIYEERILEFPETWRDLCLLLGRPPSRGPRGEQVGRILSPLEDAMGGQIQERNGRFYLKGSEGRMEVSLVAEGIRKFGMLARLISAGVLFKSGYLFWDEPESNLNPKLVRCLARSIMQLGESGTQIFLATHSLILLREFELLLSKEFSELKPRFFGLHRNSDGVQLVQSDSIDEIGPIPALEEQMEQSDRYLEIEAFL